MEKEKKVKDGGANEKTRKSMLVRVRIDAKRCQCLVFFNRFKRCTVSTRFIVAL